MKKDPSKKKKTKTEIEKENWAEPKRTPTKLETKKLFGMALERMIIITFINLKIKTECKEVVCLQVWM